MGFVGDGDVLLNLAQDHLLAIDNDQRPVGLSERGCRTDAQCNMLPIRHHLHLIRRSQHQAERHQDLDLHPEPRTRLVPGAHLFRTT